MFLTIYKFVDNNMYDNKVLWHKTKTQNNCEKNEINI